MSGGWISWKYIQLSQAKAEAETEFGNIVLKYYSGWSTVGGIGINTNSAHWLDPKWNLAWAMYGYGHTYNQQAWVCNKRRE